MLRTNSRGIAFLPYLYLLVRRRSSWRRVFGVSVKAFLASAAVIVGGLPSGSTLALLIRSFDMAKAASEVTMRKNRAASGLVRLGWLLDHVLRNFPIVSISVSCGKVEKVEVAVCCLRVLRVLLASVRSQR